MPHNMIAGLATVIYRVTDLARAKAWYSSAFQQAPYFDQPFYVGFSIGGYELGLDPDPSGGNRPRRQRRLLARGVYRLRRGALCRLRRSRCGGRAGGRRGIKVATVSDPFGNLIGLIENPHFALPKS